MYQRVSSIGLVLFWIPTFFSLALFAGMVALTVRSKCFHKIDGFDVYGSPMSDPVPLNFGYGTFNYIVYRELISIESWNGSLGFVPARREIPIIFSRREHSFRTSHFEAWTEQEDDLSLYQDPFEWWYPLPGGTPTHWNYKTERLPNAPDWLLLFLFAVLPIIAAIRCLVGKGRRSAGLCTQCGYDLRESPLRCPECGTARQLLQG